MTISDPRDRDLLLLGLVWLVGLVLSGWAPYDPATWWMEVAPCLVIWPWLFAIRRRFAFCSLTIGWTAFHGLVLMLGAAYTYARVPIGFTVQDWFGFERNPYDRFGHLMQGFVPALVIRDYFVRRAVVGVRSWRAPIIVMMCLAISALYELIEFGAALALGQGAHEFLGTQGDQWDTQWDMLMCLIGAILALLTLSHLQDRSIRKASFIAGSASPN